MRRLRHLQDLATRLRFRCRGKSLLAQQFSDESKGIDLFLQAFQFGFFAAKYFHGILHGSASVTNLRSPAVLRNMTEVRGIAAYEGIHELSRVTRCVVDFRSEEGRSGGRQSWYSRFLQPST